MNGNVIILPACMFAIYFFLCCLVQMICGKIARVKWCDLLIGVYSNAKSKYYRKIFFL